jgi:hypothetical protein
LVLIRWEMEGQRQEVTVPLHQARALRQELESAGAVIYWSERLVNHP